ncbi:MAG: exodeoxyribonuclease V subunit gamma, partial [Actinomycetota bacterium]|nr:exodeoxyribonuclease V subunit gamma [Actinomycetota bacterium]
MLHLARAGSIGLLADALAEVLADPLPDPLASEWVAVPTGAMQRWLALELARSLGASRGAVDRSALERGDPSDRSTVERGDPSDDGFGNDGFGNDGFGKGSPGGDGISANVTFAFPGSLRSAVLDAGRPRDTSDPWRVEHLVWVLLDVLGAGSHDPDLGPLTQLPEGATRFGRARRLADLFDRYAARRPDMVLQWHAGTDVDAAGQPLAPHDQWQPHVWRLVRRHIGSPSPPERLPELLARLRSG